LIVSREYSPELKKACGHCYGWTDFAVQAVALQLESEAGSFELRGTVANCDGQGTFELRLRPEFADRLDSLGVGRPTAEQQARLAFWDCRLSLLDDLKNQGYPVSNVETFVRCAESGVSAQYLAGMRTLGYHPEKLEDLVDAREHGVDPKFVSAMNELGFRGVPLATWIEAREQSIDPGFVASVQKLGYPKLSLAEAVEMLRHAANVNYILSLRAAGYPDLTIEDVIRAKTDGVDTAFVAATEKRLGRRPSFSDLIRYRDSRDWEYRASPDWK
jgi:hypothetical protein